MFQRDATLLSLDHQMKPLIISFKVKVNSCLSPSMASARSTRINFLHITTIKLHSLFNNLHNHSNQTIRATGTHLRTAESRPQAILSVLRWAKQSLRSWRIVSAVPIRCLCLTTRLMRRYQGQVTDLVGEAITGSSESLTIRANSHKRGSWWLLKSRSLIQTITLLKDSPSILSRTPRARSKEKP